MRSTEEEPVDEMEEDDIEAIVYDDSDNLPENDSNVCQACHGNEGWDENHLWIGCSGFGRCGKCDHWFHKGCLSEEVAEIDEDQLKEYELLCDICKGKKRMTRSAK